MTIVSASAGSSSATAYGLIAPARIAGWGSLAPVKNAPRTLPDAAVMAKNKPPHWHENPLMRLWRSAKSRFTAFRLQMQMQRKSFVTDDGARVRVFKTPMVGLNEKPLMVIVCGVTDAFGIKRDVWTTQVNNAKRSGHPVMLMQLPMARRKNVTVLSADNAIALANDVIRTHVHTSTPITFPDASATVEALCAQLAETKKRAGYRIVPTRTV